MTVRWGIAAPGRIAAEFAEGLALVDDAEIVAVGSRAKERADAFGDRFDIPNRYGAYDDLMEDPGVEVVYVATPHAQHAEVVLRAIAGGKHVLCEKPFALNASQAARMAAAARDRGVFAMEALWSRFLPSYRVLADLLRDERIGLCEAAVVKRVLRGSRRIVRVTRGENAHALRGFGGIGVATHFAPRFPFEHSRLPDLAEGVIRVATRPGERLAVEPRQQLLIKPAGEVRFLIPTALGDRTQQE